MTEDTEHYDYNPSLTEKQTIAWDALDTDGIKEVLYGGAKGGGKSVFGCMWCFNKAIEIIKDCNIAPRKHPIPVGFMGRKRGVDFTNTTLETWKRFIPQEAYEIKGKGLFTANPAPSFLKDEFILNPTPDRVFIQALPTDNHYLGSEYIDVLEDSFKNRPELLKAYLEGSWDALGGFNQVIKDSWIQNAGRITLYPPRKKKLITCDPARYGDDETVIYYLENTKIIEEIIYGQKSLMHTANVLHTLSHKYKGCLIAVDVCGLGAGIVDRLIEMGDDVLGIDNASKSEDPDKYYNLRSQIWCSAADKFAQSDVELKNIDPRLRGQLCTPTYEFRNGKILIEPKADIKKRLGNSPDRADAYVNGLYALDLIEGELVGKRDSYSDEFEDSYYEGNYSAMAM